MNKLTLLLIILLFTSGHTAIAGDPHKKLKGEIQLSGAFALYPMVVKWASEFKKLHPGVKIDISAGGAGKGITDALSKVVDLGMVSREVYDAELQKGAFVISVTKDAVIPIVNAASPVINDIRRHGLKKEIAQKIWLEGSATTWGKILGTTSRIPVHSYIRSDACGAAETWAIYLGKKQEDLEGTAVFGDPGIASAIQRDKIGIGFANIAYVYDQKTKRPFRGIIPIPLDVNNNGRIDPEENFYDNITLLMRAIGEGRYPSPPARDLYLVSNGKPEKPEVIEFLRFILSEGQQWTTEVGFIGLPQEKLNEQLTKLK